MALTVPHSAMANAIRFLSADAVEKAKSGHPGLPMGAADIATVLFTQVLKFDAKDPAWPDRDRSCLRKEGAANAISSPARSRKPTGSPKKRRKSRSPIGKKSRKR